MKLFKVSLIPQETTERVILSFLAQREGEVETRARERYPDCEIICVDYLR